MILPFSLLEEGYYEVVVTQEMNDKKIKKLKKQAQ